MNLKKLIPESMKSVSIIGLSKNAGKTTVLNALIETYKEAISLGIVSAGVDGEESDVWSYRVKPSVVVPEGAYVATAGVCLNEHPGDWEILYTMGWETLAGPLFLARARRRTKVKLIGVSSTSQLQQVRTIFHEMGVQLTLVDGAYDRKSSASSQLTEGTLLVVGASMDSSLERVIQKVEEVIHTFTLPVTAFQDAGQQAVREKKIVLIQDEEMEILPVSSLFQMNEFQHCVQGRKLRGIANPGAITDRILRALMEKKQCGSLIIPDATHSFVSLSLLRQYLRKGGSVEVVNPIQLVGIAINSTSAEGYSFPAGLMKEGIQRLCPQYPVFDVVREVYKE